MSDTSSRPVIFISYAHADEPEKPAEVEVKWLTFVQSFLRPAVKDGVIDVWVGRQMKGGADWDPEIETKLRACDIFILLVSAHSMASDYIIDKEIAIIRERQARGEPVHFYPVLLTPTPRAGLEKVRNKNLRPRDAKPFSGYSVHDRAQHMTEAADKIAEIAEGIARQKSATRRTEIKPIVDETHQLHVDVHALRETAETTAQYENEIAKLRKRHQPSGLIIQYGGLIIHSTPTWIAVAVGWAFAVWYFFK